MRETYELTVFNTGTQKYEKVSVIKEVYHAYMRTGWNIKGNNESYYAHEIQLSSLIGGEDGAYENFQEFLDDNENPEKLHERQEQIEALHTALATLTAADQQLVRALFFDGQSEREYADHIGVYAMLFKKKESTDTEAAKKIFGKMIQEGVQTPVFLPYTSEKRQKRSSLFLDN